MARKMKVRRPATAEIQQLSKKMNELINPQQQRRAEALMLYGMGLKPLEIADAQDVHPNTVYKDLHMFEQLGVEAIWQLQERGAPSRITVNQIMKIVQLAEQSPQAVGVPYGRWSLRKLSVYLVKQHIVKSIGHERLRQLLKKDFHFRRVQRKLLSPDPQRPAILARIRWFSGICPQVGISCFSMSNRLR